MRRRPRHGSPRRAADAAARPDATSAVADIKCIVLRLGAAGSGDWGTGGGGEGGRRQEGRRSRREKAVLPNYRDADSAVRSHLETCFSGGAEVIRPVDERLYGASWRETKLLW